jgi:hypothetical protein
MMIGHEDQPNGRAWCYAFQFPGKKEALCGTVFVRLRATNQEIEEECRKHWRGIFPNNLECPLVNLVPGSLVFVEEAS